MADLNSNLDTRERRTDEKLSFALIHLEELQSYEDNHENRRKLEGDGGPWQVAHQESFLFHLLGVLDAFYQELNVRFAIGIEAHRVNEKFILKSLAEGQPRLAKQIQGLKGNSNSWLANTREMRNHITHRARLSRTLSISTSKPGKQYLLHPRTQQESTADVLSQFRTWYFRDGKAYQ